MDPTPPPPPDALDLAIAELRPGLDLLSLAVCVLDRDARYRYANPLYEASVGTAEAEMLGRTAPDIFGIVPNDERRKALARALAGERITYDRVIHVGPFAGHWVRAYYDPVHAQGRVAGATVTLVDIQHLKDSEAALAERERQLSLITDSVGFPMTYIDREGIVRFANQPSLDWAGHTRESMVGHPYIALAPPEVLEKSRPLLERAWAGEAVTYEREAIWPGREKRRIRGHMIPDKDESGEVRGVLVVVMDIEEDHRLKEALKARTRELELVTENVGLPMAYIDSGHVFRFVNTPGLDWIPGITVAGAVGKHESELYSPEILAQVRPHVDAAMTGKKVVYERLAHAPDGTERWIRVNLVPDFAPDGAVRGIYSIVLDIDDDKRLREALERQERELRFYAQNIPEAIAFIGPDFRYQYVNRAFERVRGEAADRILGRTVPELLGEEAAREFFDPYVERLKRGESFSYERLVGPAGGDMRWYLVRLEPHMDAQGVFQGYYIVGSDIHDLKVAQERLAQEQAKLRLFMDNIPVSVAYLDTDRRYVFVNRTFADLRGLAFRDIIGRTAAEVLGPRAFDDLTPMVQRVMAGETTTYERQMVLPSGEKRWIHGRSVPDIGPDGKVRGMYVVGHDVQELKQAQEALAAREDELRFFAENIPEAIVYIDLARGCTFVNNVFLATRGFTREFILGKFPKDVYPAELMVTLGPALERVAAGHATLYERRIRIATTGEERWVRVKLTPRKEAGGRVLGYYVVSNDIHDMKAAQAQLEDKERELRLVIDSIPTPMVYVDANLRYRYANYAFLDFVGKPAGEVMGRTVEEVLGAERFRELYPLLRRVIAGETVSFERHMTFADGRARWLSVRLTPRMDGEGRFTGYYATTGDIHEQKSVEEELRRAHSALSAHFDNTPLAVIEWDPTMKPIRWSGNAEPIFGWSADEVLGRALDNWRLIYEEDEDAVAGMVRRLSDGPESQATILNRNYRKDGSVIWVEWHNSALRDAGGQLVSILSLAQDVSSRIQAEERLQYMATHDGLTGLPNRLLLTDRLASAIARADRAAQRMAVMFLDLDHFKDVNDTLGHRVGDELLKDLARRIRGTLRQSDLLVRLSGDEFVIVLENLEGDGGPDRVAQKILDDVLRPFPIEGHEVHVSASLGYAVYPGDGEDPELLLKNADAAMYHAKELGRNSYRAFSHSLAQRREQRLGIEAALRQGLKRGEFELYYQPILAVADGRLLHAEALIRWNHPERGLVLPAEFIPIAEETGLARKLGHWVFEQASRQAAAWRDAGLGEFTVCVNLSASQLRDATIASEMEGVLARTGCAPTWLTLEITETSMVKDLEGVGLTLGKLRRMGFRVAIDDFGTGFSSLSHLRHMPVDTLKIDKSFVADIDKGRRAASGGGAEIVAAVTGLARGLGLEVIAEGVEREEQLDFLRERGCDAYQGYLISRPMPTADFEKWAARHAGSAAKVKGAKAPAPPARKRAAGKKPVAKKPVAKKPAAKKPVAKKPRLTRK